MLGLVFIISIPKYARADPEMSGKQPLTWCINCKQSSVALPRISYSEIQYFMRKDQLIDILTIINRFYIELLM